jgi:hypothetical protein
MLDSLTPRERKLLEQATRYRGESSPSAAWLPAVVGIGFALMIAGPGVLEFWRGSGVGRAEALRSIGFAGMLIVWFVHYAKYHGFHARALGLIRRLAEQERAVSHRQCVQEDERS